MDPFGIVALVVGAGWLIGKLNADNRPKPPLNNSTTKGRPSSEKTSIHEHWQGSDRVRTKATKF